MKCIQINIRSAAFILISMLLNNVQHIRMADNEDEVKDINNGNTSLGESELLTSKISSIDLVLHCPSNVDCEDLNEPCIKCNFTTACRYGENVTVKCESKPQVECKGPKIFQKGMICRYCYQTELWEHSCGLKANCNSVASPRAYYATNCTVRDDILCLGHRTFNKNVKCNWTGGYRWTTALALSVTLGGFGADRFYLGHWQEGIGKLFSFGGIGVWTIIDVILISLHYIGPADGSLYI